MATKLEYVTYQALCALEKDVKKYESDDNAFVYALVVGTDCGITDFINEHCRHIDVTLWDELDDREGLVPDIVIFGGDKMGMDAGIEYINDTTVVIVEENEGGSLKRRNTSPIHAHAGSFNDYVYLDDAGTTVIVYSNISDVIQEVSVPFDPAWPTTTTSTEPPQEEVRQLGQQQPYYRPAGFPNPSGERHDWYEREDDQLHQQTIEEERDHEA